MGISWTYIPEDGLILSVWVGHISPDTWHAHILEISQTGFFQKARARISDISQAQFTFTAPEMLEGITKYAENLLHKQQFAIIAGKNFGQGRLFEKLSSGLPTNTIVFNSVHPACTWLGVDTFKILVAIRALRKSEELNIV